MNPRRNIRLFTLVTCAALLPWLPTAPAQQKAYRIPGVDLKQQVIWGATCDGPDGTGLAFGGQDQKADDGQPHTRIKVNGEWKAIHEELRKNNPLQMHHEHCRELARQHKVAVAKLRAVYFKGLPEMDAQQRLKTEIEPFMDRLGASANILHRMFDSELDNLKDSEQDRAFWAREYLSSADAFNSLAQHQKSLLKALHYVQVAQYYTEKGVEITSAEPSPRALSPIIYDEKTKCYFLFGGDHLDYLTSDTWIFDPAKKKWFKRNPANSPPPRANHTFKTTGDGRVILSGGYTYTSNTEYCGGQYRDHNDGDWTYDIAANTWTGTGKGVELNQRVYRTGRLHPDYYLQGPKPDAADVTAKRQAMPANIWVGTKPPHLPALNRDWGTAVLDPDRDLILRFSGGHSAHGGTDVLHYHLATNRWELPFPVEFPLGQLYSNTSYPEGFNFNLRPWVTGHTYQNYGYDPVFKKMLFAGQTTHCFIYDPTVADWTGRLPKPKGMVYNSCFYTLTCCPTPQGLVCWTQNGQLFQFDAGKKEWLERPTKGEKLPGSIVDNSTVVHDGKRDRLLLVRKPYGDKSKFDGQVFAVDCQTWMVSTLSPQGMVAAGAIPYLCQLRYDTTNDLLLVGATLPPGDDGLRRTPALDCAKNAWVSLKIGGDDPSGKSGRNVSLGLMYDGKRQRFWAVDTNSQVFVLWLDPKTADVQPLK